MSCKLLRVERISFRFFAPYLVLFNGITSIVWPSEWPLIKIPGILPSNDQDFLNIIWQNFLTEKKILGHLCPELCKKNESCPLYASIKTGHGRKKVEEILLQCKKSLKGGRDFRNQFQGQACFGDVKNFLTSFINKTFSEIQNVKNKIIKEEVYIKVEEKEYRSRAL